MTLQQLEKFYEDCMRTGKMPSWGLCASLGNDFDLNIFSPTGLEQKKLIQQGLSSGYWASGLKFKSSIYQRRYAFTPLRQTIVLFLIEIKKHPI